MARLPGPLLKAGVSAALANLVLSSQGRLKSLFTREDLTFAQPPAAYDEFLVVSATEIDDELADFTSTGPEVDIVAPRVYVCSTVVDS